MTLITLFFTCFLAATVVPLSSEVVFLLMLENENMVAVIVTASIGNWLGGVLTYWLGWLAKWSWIEKYLRVKKEKVDRTKDVIQKYGSWMGIFCWVPFIGDLIAIALGVFRSSPVPTVVLMFIGKFLRYLALAYLFT